MDVWSYLANLIMESPLLGPILHPWLISRTNTQINYV